jgi:hypothetical protein
MSAIKLIALLILVATQAAFASDEYIEEQVKPELKAAEDVAKTGSAASFDKRLPPVIPGESIQHNGRRMRVWSSSGPVPVGNVPQAPEAPQLPGNVNQNPILPGVGVIVDRHSDHRPDSSPGRK